MSISSVFFSFLSKIFISFNSLYVKERKNGEIKKNGKNAKKEKKKSAHVYMTIVT